MNGEGAFNKSCFSDRLGLGFLVVMILWFGHEMLWSSKVPFYRDLPTYFYPMRFSLAESFKAGELPLWNRHISMGFPLLAGFQSGAFYPLHLVYFIFPFWVGVKVSFLFHYLLAATGSFMLCRQWHYPSYLAIIGALLFSLGGTMVSLSHFMDHFQTAAWLPWVVFFWERALRSGSWKGLVSFTLILLVQFLAGSPEIYAMSMGLVLLDGLRIKAEKNSVTYADIFIPLAVANIFVAGLAMAQLAPTLELVLESWRGKYLPYSEAVSGSFHPASLLNLFFLDKEVDTKITTGVNLFFAQEVTFLISHYAGMICLFGISLWLFYASQTEKVILLGLTIISLIVAMGRYTPAYFLLHAYFPLFGFVRYPEKFFFLTYALILLITLRGLRYFLEANDRVSRGLTFAFLMGCLPLLLLYLFFRFEREALWRFIAWLHSQPVSLSVLDRSSGVLVHLERQIALTLGIFLLLLFKKEGKLKKPLFEIFIVGIVFIDLTSAHRPYLYLLDPDAVHRGPRLIETPDPQPSRLFYQPTNYVGVQKQPLLFPEYGSIVDRNLKNLLPNAGVFYGFDYMEETEALGRSSYAIFVMVAQQLPHDKLYKLLGSLNVKYVISFRPSPEKGARLVRHFPEYPSWLYRIDHVVPRVYLVSQVTVEGDPIKTLNLLSSSEFNPVHEVILEHSLSIPANKNFKGEAKIVRYRNQEVTIQASLNGSGVLVLADSFYPGWQVYVNGKQGKILRANLFFRAVPLSQGEHIVEFRYEPRSFKIGAAISLATLFGLGIMTPWITRRQRRKS